MATTAESESGSILKRIQVVYCGACGMPPEYCEYGPDFETHCLPWLKKNHPEMAARLHGGKSSETAAERPSAPWTTKERLTAFYTKYEPEKIDGVDALLEKYEGKHDKLFVALVKKYGPEPNDPYYAFNDSDDEEEDVAEGVANLSLKTKKRRGASAKVSHKVDTRVVIQKISRNKRKAVTIVVGMETVEGINLKDVSKAFSKRFAGSSSVKDGAKKGQKEIIIQGDHMEDVAAMVVDKFGVPADSVFMDIDGEFVAYG